MFSGNPIALNIDIPDCGQLYDNLSMIPRSERNLAIRLYQNPEVNLISTFMVREIASWCALHKCLRLNINSPTDFSLIEDSFIQNITPEPNPTWALGTTLRYAINDKQVSTLKTINWIKAFKKEIVHKNSTSGEIQQLRGPKIPQWTWGKSRVWNAGT